MKHELSLKQKQKLILTPQLYQAIHILQLNIVELRNLINKELIENPLLELNSIKNKEPVEFKKEDENSSTVKNEQNKNQEQENISDLLSYLGEKEFSSSSIKSNINSESKLENILSYKESLQDYLLLQLRTEIHNTLDCKIGEYIIGNIDENGYLKISLALISRDINIDEGRILEILRLIQKFDPPGVGARNLEECLLIQERLLGFNNKKLRKIITHFLPDLAKKSFRKIAKDLDVSIVEIQKMADFIKKNFDPKPGRQIPSLTETKYIIPDLIVKKRENGEYVIMENDSYFPRIRINYQYKRILDRDNESFLMNKNRPIKKKNDLRQDSKKTKEYIEEKINSAKLLMRSIEQRRKTIYRIAETLINYQRDFLDKGILFIKPLTLKEVAYKLDIHESTVSRAIHNKHIQTSRGLIKMKYLFSKGIENASENDIASDKIKKMIKNLVETENLLHPWSDQKIVDLLYLKSKIIIARRTVAKYRKSLNILPYNLRKRYIR